MKSPRKIYVLVSRKEPGVVDPQVDVFLSVVEAKQYRDQRNEDPTEFARDWRVETYVKGD